MKPTIASALLLSLVIPMTSIANANDMGEASQKTYTEKRVKKKHFTKAMGKMKYKKQRHKILKDVKKRVEETENGMIVTMTSDNPQVVQKLQANKNKYQKNGEKKIEHSVEDIANGIKITITTEDAQALERLRRRTTMHKTRLKSEKRVKMLSNGVQYTITNTDPRVIAFLHSREPKEPKNTVTITKENISNGIVVTMTTDDAELLQKLQHKAEQFQN